MTQPRKKTLGQEIVDGLRELNRKLAAGEPIEVTRVEIVSRVKPGAEECVITKHLLGEEPTP